MKITRQKRVQKILNFFKNNFGIREPYQFLLDGSFCHAALENKVGVREQVGKYLNGEVKILTTACAVNEVQNLFKQLGHSQYGAMVILKQFPIHKCGHEKTPLSVGQCFVSMAGECNPNHYLFATQDKNLRDKLRNIPGTPVLYLFHNGPLLEKPSGVSEDVAEDRNNSRVLPSDYQKSVLEGMKKAKHLDESEEVRKRRKRKGGPNPLSCKKKKAKPQPSQPVEAKKKRKSRFRVKVPKHVKELGGLTADTSS